MPSEEPRTENADIWEVRTSQNVRQVSDKIKEGLQGLVLKLYESHHKTQPKNSSILSTNTPPPQNLTTTTSEIICPQENGQIQLFDFLAFINTPILQPLRNRTLQYLLFLAIEKGAFTHKGDADVRALMDAQSRTRSPRKWFQEYTDQLVALGLGIKLNLRKPTHIKIRGSPPKVFKLFCASEKQLKAAELDYLNFRFGEQAKDDWPRVPAPLIPDEDPLFDMSSQERAYYQKYPEEIKKLK